LIVSDNTVLDCYPHFLRPFTGIHAGPPRIVVAAAEDAKGRCQV
jgi:hypothetical protein